jgi:hypothetical protein
MQHGGFAAASGSENKVNIAIQAFVNDIFDKLRFVYEEGAQLLAHHWEGIRAHGLQDTATVVVHCWLMVRG